MVSYLTSVSYCYEPFGPFSDKRFLDISTCFVEAVIRPLLALYSLSLLSQLVHLDFNRSSTNKLQFILLIPYITIHIVYIILFAPLGLKSRLISSILSLIGLFPALVSIIFSKTVHFKYWLYSAITSIIILRSFLNSGYYALSPIVFQLMSLAMVLEVIMAILVYKIGNRSIGEYLPLNRLERRVD